MRAMYLTCALLAVIISSLTTIDANVLKDNAALKVEQTTVANPSSTVAFSKINETAAVTTHEPVTTTTDNHANSNKTVVTDKINVTTAQPPTTVTKTTPSITSTTSKESPTTKEPTKPTPAPTPAPASVTTADVTTEAPSSTPLPVTTAVPPMGPPTSSPDSKERHFDGLSFLGGIILATCLMAIAAFSWKFYKTCNERNYRTL